MLLATLKEVLTFFQLLQRNNDTLSMATFFGLEISVFAISQNQRMSKFDLKSLRGLNGKSSLVKSFELFLRVFYSR